MPPIPRSDWPLGLPSPYGFDEIFRDTTIRAYNWVVDLYSVMRANGMRATLEREQPAFMKEGLDRLFDLKRLFAERDGGEA